MTQEPEMVTIVVDGEERQVPAGELLIKAAQDLESRVRRVASDRFSTCA